MKKPPANDNPGPDPNKPNIDPKTGRIIGASDNPECDTPHIVGDIANSKPPDQPASVTPAEPTPAQPPNIPGIPISLHHSAGGGYTQTLTYSAAGLPAGVSINASTDLISGTIGYIRQGGQVIGWEALLPLRLQLRLENKVVVWTNGCFDLFHAGHLQSLRQARQQGDVLVVGVNSDASVQRLKGPGRPLLSQNDRAELLVGLDCVDFVVLFDEPTPEAALARLKPDVHCKGADYGPSGKALPEAAVVEGYGGRVCYLPLLPGISTTELIRRVRRLKDNGGGKA